MNKKVFIKFLDSILKNYNLDNRSVLAATYSVLILMGIVITLFTIHLKSELEKAEILLEIISETQKNKSLAMAQIAPKSTGLETHEAYNKTRVKKYAEETNYEPDDDLENIKSLNEILEEQRIKRDQDFADKKGNTSVAVKIKVTSTHEKHTEETINIKTSVSYSLDNRTHRDLPTPVYTCPNEGTIVVNVVVDADGFVTKASINKEESSSSNRCLWDNALEYAKSAMFSSVDNNSKQKGTITYEFVAR